MDDKPKRPPRKKPAAKRPARRPAAEDAQPKAEPTEAEEATAGEPEEAAGEETVAPPTTALPQTDEPTVALPVADEPTAILPVADQPAEAPAPGYAPLSKTAVVAPPSHERPVLWIVVAVVVAAIAGLVLMWALVSGGDDAAPFLGTWARTASLGGGLTVEQDGDEVTVTWFDGQLAPQGAVPASVEGDTLSFTIPDLAGTGAAAATLRTTDDAAVLELNVAGASELLTRATALVPAPSTTPPTPAASPSPTASPSPSPTVSGSPSPSPSTTGSPSPSPSASGTDQGVVNAILAIQAGVLQYAGAHGNVFPVTTEVSETGAVGQSMGAWPANPFTGQPMKAGTQPGDYAYEQLQDGQGYRLTGYLAGGYTFTVP